MPARRRRGERTSHFLFFFAHYCIIVLALFVFIFFLNFVWTQCRSSLSLSPPKPSLCIFRSFSQSVSASELRFSLIGDLSSSPCVSRLCSVRVSSLTYSRVCGLCACARALVRRPRGPVDLGGEPVLRVRVRDSRADCGELWR